MTRRSGDPREAQTAALVHLSERPRGARLTGGTPVPWQKQVIDYDRNGPGILGYYLDIVALMASLCPLYPSVQTGTGEFERSDDPVLQVLVAGWRGILQSQSDLIYTAVRGREALGVVWFVADTNVGYNVTLSGTEQAGNWVWKDLHGVMRATPLNRIWKSINPDQYDPEYAISPIRRALPDLRRIRSAVRSQTRGSDSRLVMNGLLAFEEADGETRPFLERTDDDDAELEGIDAVIDDYYDNAKEAWKNDNAAAAAVPYAYKGKPATWVDLGRDIDPTALEVEAAGVSGFARSVNFPEQLLTQGPGAANHWNEFLLQESAVKMGLAPKLLPVCNDITKSYLYDAIVRMSQGNTGWSYDPRKVKVDYDLSFLLKRPAALADLLQAYSVGAIEREEIARQLGLPVMEIPAGMSEYEHWELGTGKANAPYAEVDADGKLIINTGTGADAVPPELAPVDTSVPLDALPAAPGDAPTSTTEPTPSPDVQEPPPPPAVTAATPGYDPNAVYDDALRRDQRLEASLAGLTAAVTSSVSNDVARQLVMAHEQRSEERRALRGRPLAEVWAKSNPQVRAAFDLRAAVEGAVAEYLPEMTAQFQATADGFWAQWGPILGATAAVSVATMAASTLATGLTSWYVDKIAAGTLATAKIPMGLIRSALLVGGGAGVDRDGTVMKTRTGQPRPATGGEWEGNIGFLSGHTVTKLLPKGFSMEWVHGWFGEPDDPYEPHRLLGEAHTRFTKLADVAPYVPNDHHGCRCIIKLHWDHGA